MDESRPLYPHQKKIIKFMREHHNGGIFVEMRLGKTLATIRRLKWAKPRRTLIVAPVPAMGSWLDEFENEGMEPPALLLGGRPERLKLLDSGNPVCLINLHGYMPLPEIAHRDFDAVILDESTFIKNPQANVTKFYTENFRDAEYRYCLTGTPNPENQDDFFSQILFTQGSFMGYTNYYHYLYASFTVDKNRPWIKTPHSGVMQRVQKEIADNSIVIRRKDVKGMDRQKIKVIRRIELSFPMRNVYVKLLKDFILRIQGRDPERMIWRTTQFIRLWQLCSGIDPDGNQIWAGKVDELVDLLQTELKGEQVVVWFKFRANIEHVAQRLALLGITNVQIHGGMNLAQRREAVARFQKGEKRIALAQEQACQTGMDLSAADTAIYYTTPVSMMAKAQTEDRILSLRKKGPLLYIYLIVPDSLEEQLLTDVEYKEQVSDEALNDAVRRNAVRDSRSMKRYVKKKPK